ncbi:Serpin family [Trema orientale]|uniref:Serpin family n=1 Tax=Trema orientale TaxID=63057 RepID=A0A2P5E7I6_TREOI|nr:Serpin family [Trema orientale]
MLQPKHFHLREQELSLVWIPKLKISYDIGIRKLMQDKGLTLPFDPTGADFRNMVHFPALAAPVYINSLIHKSWIEVNEEGTESAAATFSDVVLGCAVSSKPPLPSFVADHPFMFMIAEESSKHVIFTGALLNP